MSKLLVFVTLMAIACGSGGGGTSAQTPSNTQTIASAGGYADVKAAVVGFNAALATVDSASIRKEFPTTELLATHVDCAAQLTPMFDEWATLLPQNADIQAMKGKEAELVGIEETKRMDLPLGPFEGNCKVTSPFTLVKVKATWKLEGETHTTELALLQLGGRWWAFDIPGK